MAPGIYKSVHATEWILCPEIIAKKIIVTEAHPMRDFQIMLIFRLTPKHDQ